MSGVGQVVGRVAELWRYPVKSMQGESLDSTTLATSGVEGDRRRGVVPAGGGEVLSAKRHGRLLEAEARSEDGTVRVRPPGADWFDADDPALDEALSSWLDRPVHLEVADPGVTRVFTMNVTSDDESSPVIELPCPAGTFLDAAPVHVLSTASLAAMAARRPEGQWHRARFRPGIVVEAEGEGFVEDAWIGRQLRLGQATLAVFAPTVRCALTTRAQGDLVRDVAIATAVNRQHEGNLGIYCAVAEPGQVEVGDVVELLEEA